MFKSTTVEEKIKMTQSIFYDKNNEAVKYFSLIKKIAEEHNNLHIVNLINAIEDDYLNQEVSSATIEFSNSSEKAFCDSNHLSGHNLETSDV